jgi:hypothetical protein
MLLVYYNIKITRAQIIIHMVYTYIHTICQLLKCLKILSYRIFNVFQAYSILFYFYFYLGMAHIFLGFIL